MNYMIFQITNQLVLACKEYIREVTIARDGEDELWDIVVEEIQGEDQQLQQQPDLQQKQFQATLEARLRVSFLEWFKYSVGRTTYV